jgi:hypothetical protein
MSGGLNAGPSVGLKGLNLEKKTQSNILYNEQSVVVAAVNV